MIRFLTSFVHNNEALLRVLKGIGFLNKFQVGV